MREMQEDSFATLVRQARKLQIGNIAYNHVDA